MANNYQNNNYDNFFVKAKRTVYKWWSVVYFPVYKAVHNGDYPPGAYKYGLAENQAAKQLAASQMVQHQVAMNQAAQVEYAKMNLAQAQMQGVQVAPESVAMVQNAQSQVTIPTVVNGQASAVTLTDYIEAGGETKILESLAEEELKKRAVEEAEEAYEKEQAESALEKIENAKHEKGLDVEDTSSEDVSSTTATQEELDRANEIYERLMREAAEDEAKKQAEIDAAKAAALEKFGDSEDVDSDTIDSIIDPNSPDYDPEMIKRIMEKNKVDVKSFIREGYKAREESN